MTYICSSRLTNENRLTLLAWLKNEGLDPADIVDDGRFSVHQGVISGHKFIKTPEGRVKVRRDNLTPVLVHFRQKQKHELPEELI